MTAIPRFSSSTLNADSTVSRSPLALLALLALWTASGCATPTPADRVPDEVVRQNIFGTAYLGQQKWKDAEQAFRTALELRLDDPLLLNNAAVALQQQSRIDEARELLVAALAAEPGFPYAHYNLGLIDKQAGDFEAAAGHFEAVAGYDPADLLTQYNLGIVLSRVGRDAEAEQAFRAALARDPNHVSSLYGLGRYLMQKGEQEEGARMIALSQEIRQRSGLDTAVGLQYGEQGPYAMGVDYDGSRLPAPAPITVSYREMARSGGPRVGCIGAGLGQRREPALLCFGDDGVERLAPAGGTQLMDVPAGATALLALAAGDSDDDGAAELVAVASNGTAVELRLAEQTDSGDWRWQDGSPFGGWRADVEAAAAALTFVDFDHDGDVDLFGCLAASGGGGCMLGVNDGAGDFTLRDSGEHGFGADFTTGPLRVGLTDVDNDRDIDLFAAGPGRLLVLSNQRDGTFDDIVDAGGLAGLSIDPTRLALADLDKDGWMDLVLGGEDGVSWRRNRAAVFVDGGLLGSGDGAGLVVVDFDNDGFLDVAVAGPALLRNFGAGSWKMSDVEAPRDGAAPLLAFDADADGDLDLVTRGADGTVALLANEGGNANRWIAVDNRGVGDNGFGVGAKVEVLAGTLRQKFEVTNTLPLHAGLDDRARVESVRHLWPSGVLQDEIDLPSGSTSEITQLDRKGTSCPLLYAWRDGEWKFVTDFLGGAAVGYRHADGSYSVPDTDEYVLIEGGLEEQEGLLRLRVNNQLEEVIWFDQLELIVADHPRGTQLYPNERLMPGPPWPEYQLFASADVRPVAAARDPEGGKDLAELLRDRDGRFVDGFESLPFKGYAAPHTLELDLGPLPRDGRVVLLLDGWIDYADSTANLAAEQAGARLVPPELTVADGRGGWRATGHRMGFPAGLPKTMAVELSDLLTADDPRVRIATTMRIYWDRARVMVGGPGGELAVQRLSALGAELRFGGFPRANRPGGRTPLSYDPRQVAQSSTWKAHVGAYTAFGEVRETLASIDDRLVTTRSGDEIELTFRAPAPPRDGLVRSYLLFADGFGKDMDANSAASEHVGPIPFHDMPGYPYPPEILPPHPPVAGPVRTVHASPRGWPGAPAQPVDGLKARTDVHAVERREGSNDDRSGS